MDRYTALVEALREEIPGFRIVRKDQSRLHRAIHYALIAVTFGRMRSYLDSFQTTIGKTVYVTTDWDDWSADRRYVTLRHEAIHLRQFRRLTLPGMALIYILLPLEREAYAESIRAGAEVWGNDAVRRAEYRKHIIDQFTGPTYGWMWPFRTQVERWYDGVLASLDEHR